MSFALSVYVVDLDVLRGSIGSGDEKLRRMIGGRFKRHLAAADDQFSSSIDRGAPTAYEALRSVIDGGPFDGEWPERYAYAYKMVCEFHGRALFNNHFSPFKGDWLGEVDAGLSALGVTAVDVSEYSMGDLPKELPRIDDLPRYNEWSPRQCRDALAQWEQSTPERRAEADSYVLEAIESCADWWRAAEANDRGIAGFFS